MGQLENFYYLTGDAQNLPFGAGEPKNRTTSEEEAQAAVVLEC